jgi:hypothetical protein
MPNNTWKFLPHVACGYETMEKRETPERRYIHFYLVRWTSSSFFYVSSYGHAAAAAARRYANYRKSLSWILPFLPESSVFTTTFK